jgi:DNA-binding MarR family transcriptional regulator
LLSQVLVAYAIEFDDEAERRLPHRTSVSTTPDGPGDAPWLVSMVMWANVLQYVGPEGVTVEELISRARTPKISQSGLLRWGFITVGPDPADHRARIPPAELVVHTTAAGQRARELWQPLSEEMAQRWRDRFGPDLTGLTTALRHLVSRIDLDFPAFMPIISPTHNEKAALPRSPASRPAGELALPELLTAALLGFALDYEREAKLSLPIAANTLRVLTPDGVRVRDLPVLTGISKEANAMSVGFLERRECIEIVPDPNATRGKVVRLTPRGGVSQDRYGARLQATEKEWDTRFGSTAMAARRTALERLVGDGGDLAGSPLAAGLDLNPEGWRARIPVPTTLPHYPMVLHRGGYPDGS